MSEHAMEEKRRPVVDISGLGKRYELGSAVSRRGDDLFSALQRLWGRDSDRRSSRELWALRNFSMRVDSGTVTGIIGRNGAGKTTLLRILGRITAPTEGRINGRGRIFPMLEVGASFHPDFTARENILFNAAMFDVPREEVRRKLGEILDFAGVGDCLDDRISDMSSGSYIRLAFSFAVTMQPDLLLADEVLAVGDADFQESCIQRIRAERKRGMSVLFVSHDMAAVASICDRVAWIDNGGLRKLGAPEDVIASYEHDLWRSRARQVGDAIEGARPIRLLAARTLGVTGHEVGSIAQADAFKIELIIESHCASAAITPGVDFFAGSTLLMSAWAREPFAIGASGVFSGVMEAPPWTFTAQDIRYRPLLHVNPAGGEPYVAEFNDIQMLRVRETDRPDPDGKQHKRARAGYIAPNLPWRMETKAARQVAGDQAVGF